MKKKLSRVLFLLVSVLLCACLKEKPEEPVQIAEETEEIAETAEPEINTEPLHSPLYLPEYTAEQVMEYFEEVVLDIEYSDGEGDATLVQKWLQPIRYRIFGTPTAEDLSVLESLFAELNQISGFPGISKACAEEAEQLRICFLGADVFRESFGSVIGGEEATGATEFWYYLSNNEIYSARVGYRTDLEQDVRNSVLLEEIINSLGVSDTVLRPDSITYQYSDDNTALSEMDWVLLKLLYHPDIENGMNAQQCASVLPELYY